MTRTPVIFSGHGSPMIALEQGEITAGMEAVGSKVLKEYGTPMTRAFNDYIINAVENGTMDNILIKNTQGGSALRMVFFIRHFCFS